jgi:hypothetical protein
VPLAHLLLLLLSLKTHKVSLILSKESPTNIKQEVYRRKHTEGAQ